MTNCAVAESSPTRQQERAQSLHHTVRYDRLLQLMDEVQRQRSMEDVVRVVASHWMHCSSVSNWRLLCVYQNRCVLVVAQGNQATCSELSPDQLPAFDARMWKQRMPRHLAGKDLQAARACLPAELAAPQGAALGILPLQLGSRTIGILSVLTCNPGFDTMDRKFNALVGGAMATRIVGVLTEQCLVSDLVQAQKHIPEQRKANTLSQLLTGITQELNTPLGVQMASCEALAAMVTDLESVQQSSRDIQETIGLIDQQARRAANIVKRLKQISDAPTASPRRYTPLLQALHLIAKAHADLDTRIDCPPRLALTLDRGALATVLGELLDNARIHGGCALGAAPVHITAAEDASHIRIRISHPDNGFDPEQAAHFFDPFFTSKRNGGHIGVGGYIAQNVARDALAARLELQALNGNTSLTLQFLKP